jgi:PDZ domain-containing secreted protein/Zn-dependent protease/CBS domain-containing protein
VLKSTIRLFRVRGIPVGVNWTWLLVFLLVFWSLADALFPVTYPGLSGASYLVMALVATVLFFASILVHELSHTLRALREGVHVREITLWLFGGVSRAEEPLPTPGAEFRVVAAGPLASAALALGFWGLATLARAAGAPDGVIGVPDYLARINALLLGFNAVPALPLDGGRILHAVLWRRTGERAGATLAAAAAGRAFAVMLITIGLLGLLTGADVGGLWLAFVGWFLLQAVHDEVFAAHLEQAVSGLRVRDLMAADPIAVDPGATIEQLRQTTVRRSPHGAYPVMEGERLVGLLSLRRAAAVPRPERATATVADVMLTGEGVPIVGPDDQVLATLETLQREPGRAVVLDGDGGREVVGLLSTSDLAHALEVAPRRQTPAPGRRGQGTLGIWVVVALMFTVVAAALYHPPYVVVSPGESFEINGDITITGVPTETPTAPYLLTSVRLSQPSALGLLVAAIRNDREVIALADVVPSSISPGELEDIEQQMFLDSQQMAAAAAATAAGYDASVTGNGAQVVGLVRSSPAASVLDRGDVITAVDGVRVATTTELREATTGQPAGQRLTLTVQRDGRTLTVAVRTARLPQVSGGTGIGVLAQTKNLHVVVPFEISFRERPDVGGPSAGLAYALAITDMLDPGDGARSRAVAATGSIADDGTVGVVGGIQEKAIAAREAGADVFLVPAEELTSVDEEELEVRGVENLDQALQLLAAA